MGDSVQLVINQSFASLLLQELEADRSLGMSAALGRALETLAPLPLLAREATAQQLSQIASSFRRRGVLNPYWLQATLGARFHFFLLDVQAGWLQHLPDQITLRQAGLSQFLLYGQWDSLIVLVGTDEEAAGFLDQLESRADYYELASFAAASTPLLRGYAADLPSEAGNSEPEILGSLVEQWDDAAAAEFGANCALLGPQWTLEEDPRLVAFIGITVRRGGHGLKPAQFRDVLLANPILKRCLVDLHVIERGQPYHYFVKVVCRTREELDRATDAIAYSPSVLLEGKTFLVARGSDELPQVSSRPIPSLGITPDIRSLEQPAIELLSDLGADGVTAFNALASVEKSLLLHSLFQLREETEDSVWGEEWDDQVRAAIRMFAQGVLKSPEEVHGAVAKMATTVELVLKRAIRLIVESEYGRNIAAAQNELRLPSKDLRQLSLGKAVEVLRVIQHTDKFQALHEVLTDDWLDRLKAFTGVRNRWMHGTARETLQGHRMVDEARGLLIEGLAFLRWVYGDMIPRLQGSAPKSGERHQIRLPDRVGRPLQIYIAYSAKDAEAASLIASFLQAVGPDIFYAEWSIAPGESIVAKINQNLAHRDMLVVLLSPNSVESKWVNKELGAWLVRELAGEQIKTIPLLIAPCDIPPLLSEVKYVDMVRDWPAGLSQLLEAVRSWKRSDSAGEVSG